MRDSGDGDMEERREGSMLAGESGGSEVAKSGSGPNAWQRRSRDLTRSDLCRETHEPHATNHPCVLVDRSRDGDTVCTGRDGRNRQGRYIGNPEINKGQAVFRVFILTSQ